MKSVSLRLTCGFYLSYLGEVKADEAHVQPLLALDPAAPLFTLFPTKIDREILI